MWRQWVASPRIADSKSGQYDPRPPTATFIPATLEVVKLVRGDDRCFDDLVTTVANLLTYLFTADTIRSGAPPR